MHLQGVDGKYLKVSEKQERKQSAGFILTLM